MADVDLLELPARIRPAWTERRAARVRAAIQRKVRVRRWAGWGGIATSAAFVGALSFAFILRAKHSHTPEDGAAAQPPAAPSARFVEIPIAPGALRTAAPEPVATPLTPDTELVVDPQGDGRAFVLRQGSARFVVAHDEEHTFRVRVGPLIVEDLGTVFFVTRLAADRFEVSVDEGQVAVLCGTSRVELGRGARRTFECGTPDPAAVPALQPTRSATKSPMTPSPQAPSGMPEDTWKSLAARGKYDQAYDSLRSEGQSSVHDETEELLLAADTARLSGHPADAVPYLRRVLETHANDARAYLAAFTLGRVLLDELGKPAEAALAFDRARTRRGPLCEDALARAVEAWARAGNARRAHDLALEYRRTYPDGRRTPVVVKFGGLE